MVQGGSTITQQLAKNSVPLARPHHGAQLQEAALAIYLETRYSKDQILSLYLNKVYFGAGVYGLEAASEKFFGKHASELGLTEARHPGGQPQGTGPLQSACRCRCRARSAPRSC